MSSKKTKLQVVQFEMLCTAHQGQLQSVTTSNMKSSPLDRFPMISFSDQQVTIDMSDALTPQKASPKAVKGSKRSGSKGK